jgi:capsular exopolysaccharide synthesis family protein
MVGLQSRIDSLRAELKKAVPPANYLHDFDTILTALTREQETAMAELAQVRQAIERDETAAANYRLLRAGFDAAGIRVAALEEVIAVKEREPAPAPPTPAPQPPQENKSEAVGETVERRQVSPVLSQFLLYGGLGGLLLGGLVASGLELVSRPARPVAVVRSTSGVPVLGKMSRIRTDLPPTRPSSGGLDPTLVAFHRPTAPDAVAVREIRTQMNLALGVRDHQVVQVTSPARGDGKTTLAANLAIGLAQSGKKVVLVDCDLREPRVHTLFGQASPERGLSSVLASEAKLSEALDECEVPNLTLLLSGTHPVNPEDVLAGARFTELIDELRHEYDFVMIDSPPLLAHGDAAHIAERADGVILVTRSTRDDQSIARAQEKLTTPAAHLLGTVVNTSPQRT